MAHFEAFMIRMHWQATPTAHDTWQFLEGYYRHDPAGCLNWLAGIQQKTTLISKNIANAPKLAPRLSFKALIAQPSVAASSSSLEEVRRATAAAISSLK
jgi:hypothetical protein